MTKISLTFLPAGIKVTVPAGDTVLEAALAAGLTLDAPCGGKARCGKCLVRLRPRPPAATSREKTCLSAAQIKAGYRLACLARPQRDGEVQLLSALDSWPLLSAGRAVSYRLRRGRSSALGLALDLGTTSVAGALYDLGDGRKLAAKALLNAQISYGADLMSRLNYCLQNKDGAAALHKSLTATVGALIKDLCAADGFSTARIKEVHAVGNTAMLHFFLGQDPRPLATYPFHPSYHGWASVDPRGIGLPAEAKVRCLPHLGGFVGADCLAVILATGLDLAGGPRLAVDIGTNSEVALAAQGKILVASAAAGPALEGGSISCGMRAAPGAVSAVELSGNELKLEVLGGGPPRGVCGSGLIDLVAALLAASCLQPDGLLVKSGALAARFSGQPGRLRLLLYEDGATTLSFSQEDVRQFQLAKGAIAAAAATMLGQAGLRPAQLKNLYLAGAFGSYIDVEKSLAVGLLPSVKTRLVRSVGNAALEGAAFSLLAAGSREKIERARRRCEHVELNLDPRFQDLFAEAMHLGPLKPV